MLCTPSPARLTALTVCEYNVPAVRPVRSYTVLTPSYNATVGAVASYTRYRIVFAPLALSELGAVHDRVIDVDVWCALVGAAGAPGADD